MNKARAEREIKSKIDRQKRNKKAHTINSLWTRKAFSAQLNRM